MNECLKVGIYVFLRIFQLLRRVQERPQNLNVENFRILLGNIFFQLESIVWDHTFRLKHNSWLYPFEISPSPISKSTPRFLRFLTIFQLLWRVQERPQNPNVENFRILQGNIIFSTGTDTTGSYL